MGTAKLKKFTTEDNRIATDARALAHPARIAILKLLVERQTCICGDIVDELPLSQSTISQHLKELKNAGFIKGEVEGVKTCYCIDTEKWNQAKELFSELFQCLEPENNNC